MTTLTQTSVDHSTGGIMETISFETDDGYVELVQFDDGEVELEIGFEQVSPDEMADLLNDVADDEHMDMDALEAAFGMVEDARNDEADDDDDTNQVEDESDTEDDTEDDTESFEDGDVVHTLDDGTKVRVGDKVNCTENSHYKITGAKGEHLVTKRDPSDAWAIDKRSLERDVRNHGFEERVDR